VLNGIYCLLLFRVALFILSARLNGGCLGGDAKPTRAVDEFNHGQSFRKHIGLTDDDEEIIARFLQVLCFFGVEKMQ